MNSYCQPLGVNLLKKAHNLRKTKLIKLMLCIIYKIAASGIMTVLPIVFRVKKYDCSDPKGSIPGLLFWCPFLILGSKRNNRMQFFPWIQLR